MSPKFLIWFPLSFQSKCSPMVNLDTNRSLVGDEERFLQGKVGYPKEIDMPQGVILEEEGSEGWRERYKVMARISLQADKQHNATGA